MKFLFASDSFKGSLSSQKTAELLAKAAREILQVIMACWMKIVQ